MRKKNKETPHITEYLIDLKHYFENIEAEKIITLDILSAVKK